MKKRILIIAPILPQWADMHSISKSLNFLTESYSLNFIDPLDVDFNEVKPHQYQHYIKDKCKLLIEKYEIIFGFSLGGVIAQALFELNEMKKKKIIIFSAPAYMDVNLFEKIEKIISLIANESIRQAIMILNKYIYYPYNFIEQLNITNYELAAKRLKFGFSYLLEVDNRDMLIKSDAKYMHLIGECSQLVSKKSIIKNDFCKLIVVPNSGMRVLQDNTNYCMEPILNYLEG